MASYNPNKDHEVPNSPTDGISSIAWSPIHPSIFSATSWDNKIRCYEASGNQTMLKSEQDQKAPILCSSWHHDGSKVFCGGVDKRGMLWDLQANTFTQIAGHDAPIKEMHWIKDHNVLVTGSWDKTLRYWDLRSPQPVMTVNLTERVYCMDVKNPLVVVGVAEKKIHVFTMQKPNQEFKIMDSPLKQQSRCISCFPSKEGFALGSIEGRVAIHHHEDRLQSKNFAFKCHRHGNDIYAVNAIDFHPKFGTFATAGSDGAFNFWDKDTKQRLKQFSKASTSITCCKFNAQGNLFAYAVSYDWSKGVDGYQPNHQKNVILLRLVPDDEIKSRGRKK